MCPAIPRPQTSASYRWYSSSERGTGDWRLFCVLGLVLLKIPKAHTWTTLARLLRPHVEASPLVPHPCLTPFRRTDVEKREGKARGKCCCLNIATHAITMCPLVAGACAGRSAAMCPPSSLAPRINHLVQELIRTFVPIVVQTELLRSNINDQLSRLLTQLEDLEELKDGVWHAASDQRCLPSPMLTHALHL